MAFEPHASKHTAHHMLLYGCAFPGFVERDTPRVIWDCSEMAMDQDSGSDPGLVKGQVCQGNPEIIYAWAMDAPALQLPRGEIIHKL